MITKSIKYIWIKRGLLGFFLLVMAEETPVGKVAYLILPTPMTALFAAMANDASEELTLIAGALGAAAVFVTLARAVPLYRDMGRILAALRPSSIVK